MKRKQLIALLGSAVIALSSCSSRPVLAEEGSDIGVMAETELMESASEDFPEETPPVTDGADETNEPESPPDMQPEPEEAPPDTEDVPETESIPEAPPEEAPPETEGSTAELPGDGNAQSEESPGTENAGTEAPAGETGPATADAPAKESTDAQADTETETSVTEETEGVSEESTEGISEEETETETEEDTEDYSPEDYEYADGSDFGGGSGYYWDESWYISEDFRFTRVDKEYVLADVSSGVFVHEKDDDSSRKVGEIPYGGVLCILKELAGGWAYIECGSIRGFVRVEEVRCGESTDKIIKTIGEGILTQGDILIEQADNEAFTYTKTTSYPVIAKKAYALSLTRSWIYEYPDEKSRFVGDVSNGSLMYVLKEAGDGWYFVESGDVRGFIRENALLDGAGAKDVALDLGEENAPLAEQLIDPKENRSIYYTLLSVKSAGDELGEDICRSAASFIGKLPYVYGGTSLSSGADCSGFVQSVFAGYGINLPRTAQEQGANGQAVSSLEEAKPGDVIYYASGPHVGIYLGDGRVVQCSGREYNTADNPGTGPMISDVNYMPVTSIRRYLIIREETKETGNCRTDDTPYSQEQLEIIWAVVAQEDNGSYDGALAVISSAMNRTESSVWGYEGSNAFAQLTAPGQYCYSMDDYWIPRLHGNVPDYVKQAVDDCLNHGIRNHAYTSFRSTLGKTTGADAVQIGGNWYFGS